MPAMGASAIHFRVGYGMQIRLVTVVSLAAVMAVLCATPAAAGSRSCGTVRAGHDAARVTIFRGRVSCVQARRASKDYISGRGTFHGTPNGPRSKQYVTLPGGWRCSVIEQGGAACTRGGSSLKPRDMIGFSTLP
jgi:hypothetical protein